VRSVGQHGVGRGRGAGDEAGSVEIKLKLALGEELGSGGEAVIVVSGGTVSTVNVLAELRPVLPPESLCVACAVYVPSTSAVAASTDHASPARVVETIWTGVPSGDDPA
jgi:hypothetical protein